jgi:hypothetical protein
VSNLIKYYSSQTVIQASAGNNILRRNPLIKNKGRIKDDWSMPDELCPSGSSDKIRAGIGYKKPFSTLFNDKKFKTKT